MRRLLVLAVIALSVSACMPQSDTAWVQQRKEECRLVLDLAKTRPDSLLVKQMMPRGSTQDCYYWMK